MKKFILSIPYVICMCGILSFYTVEAQESELVIEKRKPGAFLSVRHPKYNFGFVKQGAVVKIEYEFHNTGTDTLHITDIEVTCGCTVGDFPHYPIKPGDSGMILLTFNTKEKYDRQDRTVQVISNAVNSPTSLRFKGVILEENKEKQDK